ncbi:preprotein translocase subunit SecY [candidate division NPL-UPA2 bacterium]|nr:preprotein translocase subunit SecY [candidate division NPL-UPA2 bacterium]
MLSTFRNAFRIPDLRKRIIFTASLLIVFRIGCYIPTPGIDGAVLAAWFDRMRGTLFGLVDMFAGGALSQGAIFGMGIMPFITASIIMQLLTAVVPSLEKLSKEGEAGRKKLNQYTRYGTVVVCIIQSLMICRGFLETQIVDGRPIVPNPGWSFRLMAMITLTAGTIFVMWLGEQITERGIGNGISLIITVNIISQIPTAILQAIVLLRDGMLRPHAAFILLVLTVLMTAVVVILTQAQRRIPVQHAKRIVGRRVYGQQTTYIPLRLNQAGMIPIMFAWAILGFLPFLGQFESELVRSVGEFLSGTLVWHILYVIFIIFFCYFYTAIIFNPVDIADNMKKYGSFIPGIRPGKPTVDHFYYVMNRLTLVGAAMLAFVAIMPTMVSIRLGLGHGSLITSFCGGAGLIIIVGVVLDTVKQIESHLLMRHYDGFMKKGRIKGRR